MADVYVTSNGAVAVVESDTDEGVDFVDSWLLGVLEVKDSGSVVLTAEVADEFEREAKTRGLQVSVGT